MAEKVVFPSFRDDGFTGFDMRQLVSALEYRFTSIETELTETTVASGGPFAPLSHTHVESDITDLQAYLLNINSESIFDLSDVSGTPAMNQVLRWDGSAFVPAAVGSAINLTDLANVDAPAPSNGDHLVFNSASGEWESSASSSSITTDLTGTAEYDLLYNDDGTTWHDTAGELIWNPDFDYLQLANDHTINWRDSSFTSVELLDFNSSNEFSVGDPSYLTKLEGTRVQTNDAFRITDSAETDYAQFSHDGTDFTTAHVNTSDVFFTGASNAYRFQDATYFRLDDGILFRVYDAANTDYVQFSHDGTDFNIAGTNTTDINITGVTALSAGTVDADFDDITATSYGGITEANLLDKSATEVIDGQYSFSARVDFDNASFPGYRIDATNPGYELYENDAAVDEKLWRFISQSGRLTFQTRTDADVFGAEWLVVERTAEALDSVRIAADFLVDDANSLVDIQNGSALRIRDAGDTDYVQFSHDGTDFNLVGNNTTDINITGISGFNVVNYAFDVDQTVGAGQDNYVLTYDNATGLISLEAVPGGGGISNVVEDTTPQLGGNLDVNGQRILGGAAGIVLDADGAGDIEFREANSTFLRLDVSANLFSLESGWRARIWDAGNTDYAQFSHDGTSFVTSFVNTLDWNLSGATGYIRTSGFAGISLGSGADILTQGGYVRIRDSGATDYVQFSHDGTDFNADFVNTTEWNISNLRIRHAGTMTSTNNANVDGPNFEVVTTNKSTTEFAYKVDRNGNGFGFLTDGDTYVKELRLYDAGYTDYAEYTHDGTDFNIAFNATTDWNIGSGLSGAVRVTSSAVFSGTSTSFEGGTTAINGTTINIGPTGNVNAAPGGLFQLTSGSSLRILDSTNVDYANFSHDGTNFNVATNNVSNFDILSVVDNVRIRDGAGLVIYDAGDTDYLQLYNDGSNAYIAANASSGNLHLRVNGSENAIVMTKNGGVSIYYDNQVNLRTVSEAAVDAASGAEVRGPDDNFYYVGYNTIPRDNTMASGNVTLGQSNIGFMFFYNSATARSIICNNLTAVPVASTWAFIVGPSAGTCTVDGGTGVTLTYWNGSSWTTTASAGNITAGVGQYTIWKNTDTNFYVMGPNLS